MMESCDVLVIGGGPAGSTCAWKLKKAGVDVLLLDREVFPRHKPCAGWITPAVTEALEVDPEEYCRGRVLQEIRNFRTGLVYGSHMTTSYGKTVSYGIRRYEFDHYLLQRSAVRRMLGEPAKAIERKDGGWLVNGHIRARLVVGAGGHFCPAARMLGAKIGEEEAIVAQVTEFLMSGNMERECRIPADTPELFFSRDMKGYGWVLRKGRHLNIGLGRMDKKDLRRHMENFRIFLELRGDIPAGAAAGFQGHAYLLHGKGGRRRIGDGVLLAGDAAGLSHPQSGEGILPAVESALMAAKVILKADGDYRRENLESYGESLESRFGGGNGEWLLPSGVRRFVGAKLLSSRWFTRHVVLDRWFLHTRQKAPAGI